MAAEIKMTIEAQIYGGRIAFLVARALSAIGVSEERCVRIALGMTFVRIRIGGKYKAWRRMNSKLMAQINRHKSGSS